MKDLPYHHLPDGTFRNPEGSPKRDENIKWSFKTFNKEKKKLKIEFPSNHVVEREKVLENLEKYKNDNYIAWIGHATFLIKLGDTTIITDPLFSKNSGPLIFGPKRYVESAIKLNEIPKTDLFLLTHNHYDHLDYSTVRDFPHKKSKVLVPLKLYWTRGIVKIEIGLAKGKKAHDKRQTIKDRDWKRDNFLKAIVSIIGRNEPPKNIGIEYDHVTLDMKEKFKSLFSFSKFSDVGKNLMKLRMIKSDEEIDIIKNGARIADIGAEEIVKHIKVGASELEIATVGRDKMEFEIAKTYPDAEYMDTWVWFQSGINTDGAHNPKTFRKLKSGDILSLNTFPMISGYYTALERTLFLNEIDDASLKAWEANVKVHKRGLELIKPGIKCSEICKELNEFFAQLGYLQYRTFGYGHSFGMLSHFYGREAGLELREDIHTVLEPNMVISMEPMIMIPEGKPGAGGYREHDILVIKEKGAENISRFPFGPEHNIIKG